MFNISVSSVVTDVTESANSMKATPAMAVDTTSGKRNICKNFINNVLVFDFLYNRIYFLEDTSFCQSY